MSTSANARAGWEWGAITRDNERAVNWADYVIVAVLGLSVLVGLWRGLISEVLSIVCWVLAFWVAWMFGEQLAEKFTAVEVASARLLLGYMTCFFGVVVAGAIISFVVRKLVAGTGLSSTDRLLGMFFGLARGLLLVVVAVLLLGFTPFPRDTWWHESRLMPSFERGAQWLAAQLPDSVAQYLDFHALPLPPVLKPEAPPTMAPDKPTST